MKAYLAALGAGLLVGIIYSLLNVHSPAPPVIALVGLLGILLGEQTVPLAKRLWHGEGDVVAETRADCAEHILGPRAASHGDHRQPLCNGGHKRGGDGARRAGRQGHRSGRAAGHPRARRQSHPHHPRRAQLQHGAALGRAHQPRRRNGDAARTGPSHPRPAMGARGRRFFRTQFAEKRLPTLGEINAAAPDTPVLILHLYDRALLNAAALRAVGYTKDTPDPPGGAIQRDASGNPTGLLIASPAASILYSTLARSPKLPFDYQLNSTRHFMRDLNRLGVTSVIDAGGGFQTYPDDYAVIQQLHDDGQMTMRIAYNLFTQKAGEEKEDFRRWTARAKYHQGDDNFRLNGAGEMLVFTAADFEDFRMLRPDMPANMEGDLEGVIRILAQNRWPWRLHATYDETITRALDVFKTVNRDIPLDGIHWFFDHAETISERSIDRVAALGEGIAFQHRMAYQGEYFIERYGARGRGHPAVQAGARGRGEDLGRNRRDPRCLL